MTSNLSHEDEVSKIQDLLSKLSLSLTSKNNNDDNSVTTTSSSMSMSELINTELQNIDPNLTFNVITPSLFLTTNDDGETDRSIGLQSLITIVSTDPPKYTIPALTSILNYIQQIKNLDSHDNTTTTTNNIHVSVDILKVIFQQLQHSSLEISNCATQILLLLGGMNQLLLHSPQQRQITITILHLLYNQVKILVDIILRKNDTTARPQPTTTTTTTMNEKDASILLIRNLSLMIDILISTQSNSVLYLQLQSPSLTTSTTTSTSSLPTSQTILDPIIHLLNHNKDDDPLLIMNIFELFEKMTTSTTSTILHSWIEQHMTNFLLSKVGFYITNNNGELCCNDNVDTFCYNLALTILAKCCCCFGSNNNRNVDNKMTFSLTPSMMMTIFNYILQTIVHDSYDDVEKIHFVNSIITFIQGSSIDGDDDNNESSARLKYVIDESNLVNFWFDFRQGNSKFKAMILNSFAQVMKSHPIDSGSKNSNISDEMCLIMFERIGYVNGNRTTMDVLMDLVKSSIIEIRLATYQVFESMIINRKKKSGQHLLIGHLGFLDMLLSRNTEEIKEGKEMKYVIVNGILNSEMKGFLSETVIRSLEQYVDQGPYFYNAVGGDVLLE